MNAVGYIGRIWGCRYFWLSLVASDLRTRYRRSVLGLGWSLLQPVAMMAIMCTVFHKVFHFDARDYAPYLLTGLACWSYILNAALQGCQCFFQGQSYIRQHSAPLAIYPLRTAIGVTIHFCVAVVLLVLLAWSLNGIGDVLSLVSLLPSMVLFFIFCWSLALLTGFATVHFADTQHLCEVGFQMIFYATPIIYKPELLRDNQLSWLLDYNPLVPLLELIRAPVLEGRIPSAGTFGQASAVAFAALCAAGLTLTRLQRRLIYHL